MLIEAWNLSALSEGEEQGNQDGTHAHNCHSTEGCHLSGTLRTCPHAPVGWVCDVEPCWYSNILRGPSLTSTLGCSLASLGRFLGRKGVLSDLLLLPAVLAPWRCWLRSESSSSSSTHHIALLVRARDDRRGAGAPISGEAAADLVTASTFCACVGKQK